MPASPTQIGQPNRTPPKDLWASQPIHLPDNYDPSTADEAVVRDINALNEELDAPGISAPSNSKTLRAQRNREVLITDGPYLEPKSTSAVLR